MFLLAADDRVGSGAVQSGTEADFFGDGTTSSTVTFYIPFTYGTAVFTDLHLETAAGFQWVTGYSALVFAGTAGSLGALNAGADISSASGIGYGPSSVPEPGTWFLVAFAMGVLGWTKWRRIS